MNIRQRFEAKYVKGKKPNDCWLWIAGTKRGYGWFAFEGRPDFAQRVSWKLNRGPIPKGMCVLHSCDTRPCVNPKHLFLGTRADNVVDMCNKRRNVEHKLTDNDIRAIRADPRNQQVIADAYGVHRVLINRIKRRHIWKHVT